MSVRTRALRLVILVLLFGATTAGHGAAQSDSQTPVLNSFTRQGSGTFAPGDTIQVDYSATETGSGMSAVIFGFKDASGGYRQVRADANSATGPATAAVTTTWPSGTYTLDYISLYDKVPNWVTYWRDKSASVQPSGASGPTSHTFSFSTADFTVGVGSSPTPSPSSTSSLSPSPTPSVTPSHSPAPTSGPSNVVHYLSVSLSLRKGNRPGYIVPSGVVTVDDGHLDCYMTAFIYIQRRVDGRWETQRRGDAVNKETGRYKLPVRDKPGKYRTLIKRYDYNDSESCSRAISPVRRWR